MDVSDILQLLIGFNAATSPAPVSVAALRPHAGGASHPWRGLGVDGKRYLVKYSWNPQERWLSPDQQPPQRTVVKELLCGRLGHLFMPAVTPSTCVVEVSAATLSAISDAAERDDVPPVGPSVGIRYIKGSSYHHEQWADLFQRAPDRQALGRTVVYMLWLNALDPEVLVAAQGGRLYSIDHGWYLTGQGWHSANSTPSLAHVSLASLPPFYAPLLEYAGANALRDAAAQLQSIAAERIIEQFAHVPPKWGR